jgi:O-antigen/teichoic acid export membrane protein
VTSVTIGITISSLGFQYAAARFVAVFHQDGVRAGNVARDALLLTVLISAVIAAAFFALSPYLSIYFMKSTSWAWLFQLGSVYLFAGSVDNVPLGIIQGRSRYTQLAIILFVAKVVVVAFTILGLYFYPSVSITFAAWILYSAIIVVWFFLLERRALTMAKKESFYSMVFKFSFPSASRA